MTALNYLTFRQNPYLALWDLILLVSVHHGNRLYSQLLHLITLREMEKTKLCQLINSSQVLVLMSCSRHSLIFFTMDNVFV